MTDTTSPLRDSAFMQAFLDLVIPSSEDGQLPSAGSLDLAFQVADLVEADPALGPFVQAGLQAVRDATLERDPAGLAGTSPQTRLEVVEAQLGAHPMLMVGMAVHLYPAYYQHPTVLAGLGEPPRTPFPEGYALEETDPQLLEKLRLRRRE